VSASIDGKRVITTSGWNWRKTRTVSDNTVSPSQKRSVSSGLFEKPKSIARVKELPAAVEPTRRQQLLRADDAELIADLGADQVLAAVAGRHRQVRGVGQPPVGEPGDEPGVFVVGVRRDVEHAAEHLHLLQGELDGGRVGPGRRLRRRPPGSDPPQSDAMRILPSPRPRPIIRAASSAVDPLSIRAPAPPDTCVPST